MSSQRRLSDVDIRLLHVFRTVASCRGLTAAEFELNIGRSTISKHISDLETRLGFKLCHRGPGGFSLTADGDAVLTAAEDLFSSISRFQEKLDEAHRVMSGTLKIACFDQSVTNPGAHLSEAIRNFVDVAPNVTLDMSIEPPNVIEEGVINGVFSVGIVPLHRQSPMLRYHPLYEEEMRLYCGRTHPLFEAPQTRFELSELRRHAYAGFSFNSPNMAVHRKLQLRKSAEAQGEAGLALLVKSGRFLGFLPTHVAHPFVAAGEMRELRNETATFRTSLAAITRKTTTSGRRLSTFVKCLIDAHAS